ncbi:MAG TPA: hypothetical protein VF284_11955 [Rhodanobacteraceae bacterium]
MTPWVAASLALLPVFIVAVVAAGRGGVGRRLVAVEMATALAVLLLVMFDFAFDQPSSMNLAMTLVLLALPGTLVLVLFQERWL